MELLPHDEKTVLRYESSAGVSYYRNKLVYFCPANLSYSFDKCAQKYSCRLIDIPESRIPRDYAESKTFIYIVA